MKICRCIAAMVACILFSAMELRAQIRGCGGTLNESIGVLQNMEYPYSMTPSEKCIWHFNIVNNSLVYLSLETVDLSVNDNVIITDSSNVYNYTGVQFASQQMFILTAANSSVEINLSLDAIIAQNIKRFKAEYTALPRSRNVNYLNSAYMNVIKSPIYVPKNDTGEFSWIISQKPEKNIYLSFKSFNITAGYLTIDDGVNKRHFNGSVLPSDMTTSTSSMEVTLSINLEIPNQHFELFYSYLYPNCSSEIKLTNETSKTVDFHGFPSDLPVKCFVVVEGPENSVFSAMLDWKDNIGDEKTSAILMLSDGASQFSPPLLVDSPVNNGQNVHNVVTKSNKIWIGYTYPPSVSGFNISVVLSVHNQGETLVKSGSFGVKPVLSNLTQVSNSSIFILNVNTSEQVVATMSHNTSLSNANLISFYDGSDTSHLITEFTSNDTYFHPVISTKHQMLVIAENFERNDTFEASFYGSQKGYNKLTTEAFGAFRAEKIISNASQNWIIAPRYDSSELIALTITNAQLTPDIEMTIFEGTAENSSKVVYELTNTSIKSSLVYISSEKGVSVNFKNKGNTTNGLIADLSYNLAPVCNYTLNLTTQESAVFSSINFPSAYPLNAECEWHVISDKSILFNFKAFDLPSTHPFLIYSVNNATTKLLSNISGSEIFDDLIITESHIIVNWSSLSSNNNLTVGKGFEIEVLAIDCGGLYNESTKQFSTPSYPATLKNSTLCVWSLNIPPKQGDKVEIVQLSYTSSPVKSSLAELTIYEGGSLKSPKANMSSPNVTIEFLSRTNKLLVMYNYSSAAIEGTPYSFTANTYACAELCKNGICLHASWKCDGQNDCGDYSDEIDCEGSPIIEQSTGVSVTGLVVAILLCLTIGAVGAITLPYAWKRLRAHGRNYQEFRNAVDT